MFEFEIRSEVSSDHDEVDSLLKEAFGQPDEAILVARLRKSKAYIPGLSLVAESEGKVIGQILFTSIQVQEDSKSTTSLALAPMSVRPKYQSRGVGGALIRSGLQKCRELGHGSVVVLGHAEYYPRFGFDRASRWGIRAPFEVADEYFMAMELIPGALKSASGVVKYAEEFGI